MPFDGTEYERDLSVPSLENLAALLRDRSKWPDGFEWDYRSRQGCAIGIACRFWKVPQEKLRQTLGVSRWTYWRMFAFAGPLSVQMRDVTPGLVADVIDHVIASRRA